MPGDALQPRTSFAVAEAHAEAHDTPAFVGSDAVARIGVGIGRRARRIASQDPDVRHAQRVPDLVDDGALVVGLAAPNIGRVAEVVVVVGTSFTM